MSLVVEAKTFSTGVEQLQRADPCSMVILGASGDLTRRKLVPALFNLARKDHLEGNFKVLGVGREEMTNFEFRERMREGVAESKEIEEFSEAQWQSFASCLNYITGDLTDYEVYRRIASLLENMTVKDGASTNHLFYCSTPPSLAPFIVNGFGAAELAAEQKGWSRIVLEKPFGRDLNSARALNAIVNRVFKEHQVYRIDHYLGKETVQNITVFRFGNSLFEPVWNRNYVDYVEITAAETLGVGSRGNYYEEAGALRDMVANHLLQLLALTAMEPPVVFDADWVRAEKVQVWSSIHPMTPDQVAEQTVRGQYGPGIIDGKKVPGYRQEPGVAKNSLTETYVAVDFRIDNWRWSGVPFYLRTGKRLVRSITEIAVHLKRTPQSLFAKTPADSIEPNVIVMRIQPNEGIMVTFCAKRPGTEMHTSTVHMDFCYQKAFGVRMPTAYETLLLNVMRGDSMLFERSDGIEAQWKLITPILQSWEDQSPPDFPNYPAGTEGPTEADDLLLRNGHKWRPLVESLSGCE